MRTHLRIGHICAQATIRIHADLTQQHVFIVLNKGFLQGHPCKCLPTTRLSGLLALPGVNRSGASECCFPVVLDRNQQSGGLDVQIRCHRAVLYILRQGPRCSSMASTLPVFTAMPSVSSCHTALFICLNYRLRKGHKGKCGRKSQ